MPVSSSRAPVRSSEVSSVVDWRANASRAICRTRTCSRERLVGRREAEGGGPLGRERVPRAGEAPVPRGAEPGSGRVTLRYIGGGGADPDRRRDAAGQGGAVGRVVLLGHVLGEVDAHDQLGVVLGVGLDDLLLQG